MRLLAWSFLCLTLSLLPALAQPAGAPFKIDFDPSRDVTLLDRHQGKAGLFIHMRFSVSQEALTVDLSEYSIVVEEDGHRVKEDNFFKPAPTEDLTVALAIDTSGSMKTHGRMAQVRNASRTFLEKLPSGADCGLILFDHEVRPPVLSPGKDRRLLSQTIEQTFPRGGTAYFDAVLGGIQMVQPFPKREKAVVLLTDGIDLGSTVSRDEVIRQARQEKVRIYTIGIGEPGRLEPVNTVLVLDHSGSMRPPADRFDKTPKIKALHRAATRFVRIMPTTARATLIPFSTEPAPPKNFTQNKSDLIRDIESLRPAGETALFDAIYAAIATLDAENPPGKKIVIAMTDGVDNASRHTVQEVIAFARETGIKLFLLGFGQAHEIDDAVMRQLALNTQGEYFHAKNERDLIDIFERLSIQIHDEGIDEVSLKELASKTGGQYYPAKNVNELQLVLEKVTQNIQKKTYEWTFPSLRQVRDGTQRNIALKLVRRSGEVVGSFGGLGQEEVIGYEKARYHIPGVVVAQMDPGVYLILLAGLGFLVLLPSLLGKQRSV